MAARLGGLEAKRRGRQQREARWFLYDPRNRHPPQTTEAQPWARTKQYTGYRSWDYLRETRDFDEFDLVEGLSPFEPYVVPLHLDRDERKVNSRAYTASFGFKGADQQKKIKHLSGGERNRAHLARLLKAGGNVLLLDEPTNDLDVDTLRALEEALLGFAGCAIVISHDRWFLDRVATHILAFEGDSHVEWFAGNYADYEADYKARKGHDADRPHRIKYRKLTRG